MELIVNSDLMHNAECAKILTNAVSFTASLYACFSFKYAKTLSHVSKFYASFTLILYASVHRMSEKLLLP